MATVGNNDRRKYSDARDIFFSSKEEREQFKKLMQDPNERKKHYALKETSAKELYEKAMDLIHRAETGEFDENQMEKIEYVIAHCLAAIDDLHRELILEHTI